MADDGKDMSSIDLEQRLPERHLGVASQRIRVATPGGWFRHADADPYGTISEIEVPAADTS